MSKTKEKVGKWAAIILSLLGIGAVVWHLLDAGIIFTHAEAATMRKEVHQEIREAVGDIQGHFDKRFDDLEKRFPKPKE